MPLCRVQGQELLQKLASFVDDLLDGGIQVIADLAGEHERSILQVDQAGFRGGIPLVGFCSQGGVLRPCLIGGILSFAEKLCSVRRPQKCVPQPDLSDPDIVQGFDGVDAFLIHFGQAHDKCLESGSGVPLP